MKNIEINLNEKYTKNDKIRFTKSLKSKFKNIIDKHPKFKVGDVISFWGGFNDDIRYTSTILCFDTDGDIYVLWDCYWFPIKDEKKRDIKLLKK